MGLFVAEDGHFQGWLAALLCCFAAVNEDEHSREEHRSNVSPPAGICNVQPMPSTPPSTMTTVLTMNAFKGKNSTVDGTRQLLRVPDHPPLISPLDFGERSLMRTWPVDLNSKHRSPESQRLVISGPHSLRRLDYTDAQKQALIPLRLGPVVLRDLPTVPDAPPAVETSPHTFRARSDSTEELIAHDQTPRSAIRPMRRESLPQLITNITAARQDNPPRATSSTASSTNEDSDSTQLHPYTNSSTSPSSLHHRNNSSSTPTSISSLKSRTSSERRRLRRKRSFPVARNDRLDQEILELNTIVEERRAEIATRENASQQQHTHVAAVAPAMQIDARSETLNAIGSALSKPLASQGKQGDAATSRPRNRRSVSATSWGQARRLSGWLSGVLPTSNPSTSPAAPVENGEQPFYQCQIPGQQLRRTHSEASVFTFLTELDSPSLTEASSPTSRGFHSRNLTDESAMSPISPLAERMLEGKHADKTEEQWPVIVTPSVEVGLAL